MTDVLYMAFTNLPAERIETRLDALPTLDEQGRLMALTPGVQAIGGVQQHVAHIDFEAQRATRPPTPVWVRVVCRTAEALTDEQREAVQAFAHSAGVLTGRLHPRS